MTSDRPTIVEERAGRRNGSFAIGMALLVAAIVSPMLRDEPIDTGTQVAIGALVVVALGAAGLWLYLARNPAALVVGDSEIRLDPPGGNPELRVITRPSGGLRLAKEGSVRSKTLVLSSRSGSGRIPLHFMDQQEIVDACHAHGWAFGEPSPDERLVAVLDEIIGFLRRPDVDISSASFVDEESAIAEVTRHRDHFAGGATTAPIGFAVLFAPTGPLQETSLSSGWGDRFVDLADEVDAALVELTERPTTD